MSYFWTYSFLIVIHLTLTWLSIARCQLDSNVCEEVDYSCGPLPPKIPTNYIMKREVISKNKTYWEEQYFDNLNLRKKHVSVSGGIEFVAISDYAQNELMIYSLKRPGASVERDPTDDFSCVVTQLNGGSKTRMPNAFQELTFGGNYRYKFTNVQVNQFISRNLPLDAFNGCVFDEGRNGAFNMSYMFVQPSSSLLLSNGESTMPIRVTGKRNNGEEYKGNIAWFKSNPNFSDQEFQVPRDMHCVHILRGRKKLQPLPKKFSFRRETIAYYTDTNGEQSGHDIRSYEEVWYDRTRNLVRLDVRSDIYTEIVEKLGSGMASITMDFSHDVALMTNTENGNCRIEYIPRSLNFLVNESKKTVEMQSPETVFGISDRTVYKGKYKVRGINVDTWTEDVGYEGNITTWREISFATDDWHSQADGKETYMAPVQEITLMSGYPGNVFLHRVSVINYFKMIMEEPPLSAFQNQKCFDQRKFRTYEFRFPDTCGKIIEQRRDQFLEALRVVLSTIFDSYLRIAHPEIAESNDNSNNIIAVVNVLEEMGEIKLKSLDDAYDELTTEIQRRELHIIVTTEGGNAENIQPDSVTEIKQDYDSSSYELRNPYFSPQYSDLLSDSSPKNQDPEGYSPGSLAAVAICMLIVGLLIGGGAMIYYLRKMKDKEEKPIPLTIR